MLREHANVISKIRMLLDSVATAVSFGITALLWSLSLALHIPCSPTDLLVLLGVNVLVWPAVFYSRKLYSSFRFEPITRQIKDLLVASMLSAVLLMALITIFKLPIPGRKFLFMFITINVLMLITKRLVLNIVTRALRRRHFNTRHIVVVGSGREALDLIDSIKRNPGWGIQILGIVQDSDQPNRVARHLQISIKGYPVLGSIKDLELILDRNVVDTVFFAISPWNIHHVRPSIMKCIEQGISVRVSGEFFRETPYVSTAFDHMDTLPVLSFMTVDRNAYQLMLKEFFDRASAGLALLVLSPFFALIALAIRLESRGPVFFRQKRVGVNGRIFEMYKFRSMCADAEQKKKELAAFNEMSGPVFKMTNDPRITRVGSFLRKTSLDELPQLINVVMGDMSLVGPRPPLPSEVKHYDNWQKRRLSVKPGITCIWQVSGRNNIDFDTWMKMDLQYIDNWSLGNDAKLLLKTVPAVLMQRGSK